MEFPSSYFYKNKIKSFEVLSKTRVLSCYKSKEFGPFSFFDLSYSNESNYEKSFGNQAEANVFYLLIYSLLYNYYMN